MNTDHSSFTTRLLTRTGNNDAEVLQHKNGHFALKEIDKERLMSLGSSSENIEGKKIDFILVYFDNDGQQRTRDLYEKNLKIARKLELEHVASEANLCYVKVHAPLEVLYQKAEDMNIQMPLKKHVENPSLSSKISSTKNVMENLYEKYDYLDPFIVNEPTVKFLPKRIKTTFSSTNVAAFESKNGEHFFENAERSRMVHRILQLTSFTGEEQELDVEFEEEEEDNSGEVGHGIEQLCHDGVYKAYFPMHDGPLSHDFPNDRLSLQNDWASFRRMFKYQPLDAIRSYYGVRVSFYFAWFGAYNMFLIPAAVVGVLCFIYGAATLNTFPPLQEICNKTNDKLFYMCPQCDRHCSFYTLTTTCLYSHVARLFDNAATVFFSVFMSVWATLFLEYWKRTEASLAFKWDVYGLLKEYEPLRPKFVCDVKQTKENPVTNKPEPYIPTIIRVQRAGGALGVVFFMILVVIGILVGIIVYRAAVLGALYAQSRHDLRENAKLLTSFTAACINLLFIQILTFVYVKIAVFLTNWENPRTVSEFHNSFTLKMYTFEFVNTYSALFYVAFFQSSLINGNPVKFNRIHGRRIEECHPAGCLIDVCIQLAVIMVGKQMLRFIVEFGWPSIRKKWVYFRHRSSSTDHLPQWENDYLLSQEPDFRMFYEYLDMVIQFGFVTMFVASFPLAPLFALLNNMIELRSDAMNFIINYRRRVSEQVSNIGIWFKILDFVTKISVVVNSFVIAFTAEFIPRLVYGYGYSSDGSLRGYVNNSLTYIKITDLESLPDNIYKNLNYTLPYCRFKEYIEPRWPYDVSKQYLYVMLVRLVFVIVFQYFVFCIKDIVARLVPDIPKSLQSKISRKMHVARMCFRKSAVEALRETTRRQRERQLSRTRLRNDGKMSRTNMDKGRNLSESKKAEEENGTSGRHRKKTDISSRTYV